MKNFYLLLLIFIVSNFAFAFENVSIPQNDYAQRENIKEVFPISDEEISKLEKIILKKEYKADNPKNRILRMEKEVFGMEQNGDYETRFDNLITVSDYYKNDLQKEPIAKQNYIPDKELNSRNYITNYNFDEEPSKNRTFQEGVRDDISAEKYYNYEQQREKKKQSRIKQFFSDLADAVTSGVVTGYTPSINGYYGFDPIDTYMGIGGSGFGGLAPMPVYPRIPRVNSYVKHYQNPHLQGRMYGNVIPRRNYYLPPTVRHPHNYYRTPYNNGNENYGSGMKVKIIN